MTEGKRAELLKAEMSAWSKRWRNTAPVSGWEWLRAVNVAHFILISLVIQLNAGGWTLRQSERCVPSSVSNWRESAQFVSPVGLRTLCSADVIIQPFYYFSSFCVHKVMTQSDSPDADCWWFKARQWFHGRLFQATFPVVLLSAWTACSHPNTTNTAAGSVSATKFVPVEHHFMKCPLTQCIQREKSTS